MLGVSHQEQLLSRNKIVSGLVFFDKFTCFVRRYQTIGMVFEAVNRKAYHNYLRVFHRQLDITALDPLYTTRRMCFMGITVNRNKKVIPHKDVKDFRDGWAVMCYFGDFIDGGEPTLSVMTPERQRQGVGLGTGQGMWFCSEQQPRNLSPNAPHATEVRKQSCRCCCRSRGARRDILLCFANCGTGNERIGDSHAVKTPCSERQSEDPGTL